MKLKKKRKAKRMRGHGMGSHGWGARKKHMGSGHRGGFGMAGTGKMAGQKKTYITKLHGMGYFGRSGFTSRKTEKKNNPVINVGDFEKEFEKLKKKFGQKDGILNMKDYKILGEGDIKIKITVKAKAASASAKEKIEKAGGKLMLQAQSEEELKEKQ